MISKFNRNGRVVVWTMGDCCPKTGIESFKVRNELNQKNIAFDEVSIMHASPEIQRSIKNALAFDSGYQSFPTVYVGGAPIGGYEDLKSFISCDIGL